MIVKKKMTDIQILDQVDLTLGKYWKQKTKIDSIGLTLFKI